MAEPFFVVTGASGHVGSVVAARLLDKGKQVRVIGRSAERLKSLTDRGAEVSIGSLEDETFVLEAFKGATAAFVMIPPNFQAKDFRAFQNRVGKTVADALQSQKINHALTLSSVGANLPKGNGPVAGLYDMEQRLNRLSALNVLHLRAGYFMENQLTSIPMIKSMNILAGAFRPDVRLPMIATRDIGEMAVEKLAALDFKGSSVQELLGPRDVTMTEVATAIGKSIGKPDLKYVQSSYDEAEDAMMKMGVPENMAALFIEMTRGFNEGKIRPTQPRSPSTNTPTTIEAFTDAIFGAAYRAS